MHKKDTLTELTHFWVSLELLEGRVEKLNEMCLMELECQVGLRYELARRSTPRHGRLRHN